MLCNHQILGRHCCSNDTWGREKESGYVCAEKKGTGWIQEKCHSSVGNPSLAHFLLKCWKCTLGAACDLLGGQKMWPQKCFGALGKLCLCRRAIWLITPAGLPRNNTCTSPMAQLSISPEVFAIGLMPTIIFQVGDSSYILSL